MSATNIEWTDRTWNPVTGCTKVSQGCKHCYAEGVADRFWATQYPEIVVYDGRSATPYERARRFTDVQTHADRLLEPLSWRKPAKVFVNSMSDLFHEAVPDEFISHVFAAMALAPRHTFQILTKRPDRMRAYLLEMSADPDAYCFAWAGTETFHPHASHVDRPWPLPNVWLGVSVEDQATADARIPLLLDTPAAVRFISAEPLLGPVILRRYLLQTVAPGICVDIDGALWHEPGSCDLCLPRLDWVIVGGESGPHARPCDVAWVQAIARDCRQAGVPVFVKQLGAVPTVPAARLRHWEWGGQIRSDRDARFSEWPDGRTWRVRLDDRKGGDPAEWPEDLRVRQFPEVRA